MTAYMVLASNPSTCAVCAQSRRMRLVMPLAAVALRVECPHCQPPRIPVLSVPMRTESPKL